MQARSLMRLGESLQAQAPVTVAEREAGGCVTGVGRDGWIFIWPEWV